MTGERVGDADDQGKDQPEPQDVGDEAEATEHKQQKQGKHEQHGDLLEVILSPVVIAIPSVTKPAVRVVYTTR
jgi:hypothetical protein